mmetsp:Transcript_7213/g.21990  ORF Transcript_7213/g.21990 Transcript_7213/m.21990 type:complete len:445 (-) Transcript_7213:439-1773(-)|eukprot:CAMPEP_0198729884 /NCGR_PEP_ID=MMETSP1475-20131203/21500_1 /TAXON_ID= ORGANISM="Unidentified sp., Strain CCMP1999" /NCGR_SAMPLE_ID=MMETSP1475 /ASSEMBLY_ACC=CAM_ASM_001111 /LENGTH=444 /DNA_ID=CAMNT_0044492605 /DNA_START=114 /DNA_END=1448 /DNA_ORIENTATION=+
MVASTAQAPWTVISQGSPLTYEQADLLDQFEYGIRTNADLAAKMAPTKMKELSSALMLAMTSLTNTDGLKRAVHMLVKILGIDRSAPDTVLQALPEKRFQPFLRQFSSNVNMDVATKSAAAMGMLLCSRKVESLEPQELVSSQTQEFMEWVCKKLSDNSLPASDLVAVLSAVGNFLRKDENRIKFIKEANGASIVGQLLEKDRYSQVQVEYQAIFVFWLLSFTSSDAQTAIVEQAMNDAEVPRKLTSILREISAEKVVRITLSVLRNLAAEKFGSRLRREMVGAGLVSALEQLCLRRWNDGDIRDDLFALAELMQQELQVMSTFDVYRGEVLSGALSWTPVHKDEVFWRENTEKMELKNLELLRCLVRCLHESSEPVVLSVACHDLGMFIKHHERGRHIAQSLGVKPRLMELMTDADPEVRRHALTCVQILMISHYELMPGMRK